MQKYIFLNMFQIMPTDFDYLEVCDRRNNPAGHQAEPPQTQAPPCTDVPQCLTRRVAEALVGKRHMIFIKLFMIG